MSDLNEKQKRQSLGQQPTLPDIKALNNPAPQNLLHNRESYFTFLKESLYSNRDIFLKSLDWVCQLIRNPNLGDHDDLRPVLQEVIAEVQSKCSNTLSQLDTPLPNLKCSEPLDNKSKLVVYHMELSPLARRYLDLLLLHERQHAFELIRDAYLEDKVSVKELYMNVFQPALIEVGLLWEQNVISVAQEHFCTAATQLIMSQLYPYFMNKEDLGLRFVGTSIEGNLHEIGIRMVCDFFEIDGWDTQLLGANTPNHELIGHLEEDSPQVLGISVTLEKQMERLCQLTRLCRDHFGKDIFIIAGGPPFMRGDKNIEELGLDAICKSPQAAVDLAKERFQ